MCLVVMRRIYTTVAHTHLLRLFRNCIYNQIHLFARSCVFRNKLKITKQKTFVMMKACSNNSNTTCRFFKNFGDPIKEHKATILVVDDSPIIIEKINEIILQHTHAFELKSCGTHHEAVQLINELSPSGVILDINLPDKSGIEVLRYIKQNYPETLVIMCTNQGGSSYREGCFKLGANYFIDKSKDFEKIPLLISKFYN
jgi:CheY-like chemotaxis protein